MDESFILSWSMIHGNATNQLKVYKLFYFCSDLVFTLVFPHLTTALFCPEWVNPLGSAVAFIFGALMR